MISSFIYTEIFNISIIYIQVGLKIIHKCIATGRSMYIFYEQAVCIRGTKIEKSFLDNDGK